MIDWSVGWRVHLRVLSALAAATARWVVSVGGVSGLGLVSLSRAMRSNMLRLSFSLQRHPPHTHTHTHTHTHENEKESNRMGGGGAQCVIHGQTAAGLCFGSLKRLDASATPAHASHTHAMYPNTRARTHTRTHARTHARTATVDLSTTTCDVTSSTCCPERAGRGHQYRDDHPPPPHQRASTHP